MEHGNGEYPPPEADDPNAPPLYVPPSASSSLASQSPSQALALCLSSFASLTPADVGAILQPHLPFVFSFLPAPSLLSLLVSSTLRQQWRQPSSALLTHLVPCLPSSVYLSLRCVSKAYHRLLSHQSHQQLQHVSLSSSSSPSSPASSLHYGRLSSLHRSLPHLQQLTLSSFPVSSSLLVMLDLLPLRCLRLVRCHLTEDDAFDSFASSTCLRRLQSLTLESLAGFDDATLQSLLTPPARQQPPAAMTSLSLLSLSLSSLSGAALSSLSRCFPSLTALSLARNAELTDGCVLAVASSPLPLTSLSLAHCELLTADCLHKLSAAFASLSELDLSHCPLIASLPPAASAASLSALPLTSLSLAHTSLPTAAFATLSHLPLRFLSLSCSSSALRGWLGEGRGRGRKARLRLVWEKGEDEGLSLIRDMGVQRLEVAGRGITDRGLQLLVKAYQPKEQQEEKKEQQQQQAPAAAAAAGKHSRWFSRPAAAASSPSPVSPLPSPTAPPPAGRPAVVLSSLLLRDVSVTDAGLLASVPVLLSVGLRELHLVRCKAVSWRAVESLMHWRRQHAADVDIHYEL